MIEGRLPYKFKEHGIGEVPVYCETLTNSLILLKEYFSKAFLDLVDIILMANWHNEELFGWTKPFSGLRLELRGVDN